mgnify:CR=1 FL=1
MFFLSIKYGVNSKKKYAEAKKSNYLRNLISDATPTISFMSEPISDALGFVVSFFASAVYIHIVGLKLIVIFLSVPSI